MSNEAFAIFMTKLGYVRVPGSDTTWMSRSLQSQPEAQAATAVLPA